MRNRRVQGQLTAILCAIVVPSFGRVHAGRVALVGHSLGSLVAI
jgi:hypothetical protein